MLGAEAADQGRSLTIAVENAVLLGAHRVALAMLTVIGMLLVAVPADSVEAHPRLSMDWPTVGRLTQPFGCTGFWAEPRRGDCAHFHAGIDIANRRGTRIHAAAAGTIKYVGREPWYHGTNRAWVVIISHGHRIKTIYVHLQARTVAGVKAGRHVEQGQLIGYMGATGRATGPHLHFGVWVKGVGVDPAKFCPGGSPPLR